MIFLENEYKGTVFFDLDGTLLNKDSRIDLDVANATKQLQNNGYLPVVNTGRSIIEIDAVTSTTDIDTFVTLNGSYVESNGEAIFESTIKPGLLDELSIHAKAFGDPLSFHSAHSTRLNLVNKFTKRFYESVKIQLPEVDPKFYRKEKIPMVVIITASGSDKYQDVMKDLTFYKTGPFSIDAVNNNISKMTGIKQLLSSLNMEDKPVYAFGDGDNDFPMIEFADYGIAMGNANDSIKGISSYVTTSNSKNGIVNGLKHYGLI